MAKVKIVDKESGNPIGVVTCDHCGEDFNFITWNEMSCKDVFFGIKHAEIKFSKCGKFQNPTFDEKYPMLSWFKYIACGIIIGISFYYIFSDSSSEKSIKLIKPTDSKINSVVRAIETEFQSVYQVIYNSDGIYNWIIVVNDPNAMSGSWKGYSRAICNILYEKNVLSKNNLSTTIDHRVRIVDRTKFINTDGNFRRSSLGSTNCKTWEMRDI